jgi:hypothetical protein
MKIIARILLLFFVLFLSKPIVVRMIEKSTSISCIIDSDNQNSKDKCEDLKEDVKVEYYIDTTFDHTIYSLLTLNLRISQISSIHPLVFEEIFSPPPEIV